jgi:hypothetical protein
VGKLFINTFKKQYLSTIGLCFNIVRPFKLALEGGVSHDSLVPPPPPPTHTHTMGPNKKMCKCFQMIALGILYSLFFIVGRLREQILYNFI